MATIQVLGNVDPLMIPHVAMPSPLDGQIARVGTVLAFPDDAVIEWFVDGVQVGTEATFTVAEQYDGSFIYGVGDWRGKTYTSNTYEILRDEPAAVGTLADVDVTENAGAITVSAATVTALFSDVSGCTFGLSGVGSINSLTGEMTFADVQFANTVSRVTVTNSGGSAYVDFNVNWIADASTLTITAQPSITKAGGGSFSVGDMLDLDPGTATGPNAFTQEVFLFLGGTSKVGEIVADQWDTSGETAGTITYYVVYTDDVTAEVFTSDIFTTTLNAVATGSTIVKYESAFDTDQSAAFTDTAADMYHDPAYVYANEPVDGAMRWTSGATTERADIEVDVDSGRNHQMLYRFYADRAYPTSVRVRVMVRNAAGGIIATITDTQSTVKFRDHLEDIPAFDGQASILIRIDISYGNARATTIDMAKFGLYDVTDSGGFPQAEDQGPVFWGPPAYVGEPFELDFTGRFSGNIDSYRWDGPEPAVFTGANMVVTPDAVITDTVERYVFARNGDLESVLGHLVYFNVDASPAAIADAGTYFDQTIEVGRAIFPMDTVKHVTGGTKPFSYSIVTGPSWVKLEASGLAWGVVPSAVGADTLTVRVTDQRGATVDLTSTITTIAARDRVTGALTITPGQSIADFVRANSATKRFLLQAGSYTWGNMAGLAHDPEDPCIISGPATALVERCNFRDCSGFIMEGFTVERTTFSDSTPNNIETINTASDLIFNDMHLEGYRFNDLFPVSLQLADATTSPSDDGSGGPLLEGHWYNNTDVGLKYRWSYIDQNKWSSWGNDDDFTHYSTGAELDGDRIVFNNVSAEHVFHGFVVTSHQTCMHQTSTREHRADGVEVATGEGIVFHKHTTGGALGNHKLGEHRDLFQPFSNNEPSVKRLVVDNCFLSCEGTDKVQGLHYDDDGWGIFGSDIVYTEDNANGDFVLRDTVIFASINHGLLFERIIRGIADKVVILPHPDVTFAETGMITHRRASEMAMTGILYNQIQGDHHDGQYADWTHICTVDAASYDVSSGSSDLTYIFPNWNNTGLTYEDPREAVANSAAASTARFYIDPAGAWSVANPTVGPSWLRDGLTGLAILSFFAVSDPVGLNLPIDYVIDRDSVVHVIATTGAKPTAAEIHAGQQSGGTAAPVYSSVLLPVVGEPVSDPLPTGLSGSYSIYYVVDGGTNADVTLATNSPVTINT